MPVNGSKQLAEIAPANGAIFGSVAALIDELRFLFRLVLRGSGWLATGLGATVVALGTFYDLMDWRFGGAFRVWSWMWGLMLIGLGLVLTAMGRRWLASVGVLAAVGSGALVFHWERHVGSLGQWPSTIYAVDAFAIAAGLAAIAYWTWRRLAVDGPPAVDR